MTCVHERVHMPSLCSKAPQASLLPLGLLQRQLVPGPLCLAGQPTCLPRATLCQPQPHLSSAAPRTHQPQVLCTCYTPAWVNPTGAVLPREAFLRGPNRVLCTRPSFIVSYLSPLHMSQAALQALGLRKGQSRSSPGSSGTSILVGRKQRPDESVIMWPVHGAVFIPWKGRNGRRCGVEGPAVPEPPDGRAGLGRAHVREPSGPSPAWAPPAQLHLLP